MRRPVLAVLAALAVAAAGCGGGEGSAAGDARDSARGSGSRGGPWGGEEASAAAVPVEVAPVERRTIAAHIETNGTLEAENEVDLIARVSAPIVEIRVEEGMEVRRGAILARLDEKELAARAEVSRVSAEEARLARERAERLHAERLISPEEHEQAANRLETAAAQYESDRIQLGYAEIRAPFDGLVVARYVKLAQQVGPGDRLFRLSDFDPLLCPIQVPERDLPRLAIGQRASLLVEAWPGERFEARLVRISPVVDAATGTVKVTLEADAVGRLRPGMFARVFLETERRLDALVIPRAALSLESIGDTVYVTRDGRAERREVRLGYREGGSVEVLSGVEAGELVVVVGQDGLSDGTPVRVLGGAGEAEAGEAEAAEMPAGAAAPAPADVAGGPSAGPPGGFDPASLTPERLEEIKERMRARGLSEAEVEERVRRMREGRPPGER